MGGGGGAGEEVALRYSFPEGSYINAQGEARRLAWDGLEVALRSSLKSAYPELVDDAIRAVTYLLCNETARSLRE